MAVKSSKKESGFEFFPREERKPIRLDEAYALLLFLGTFGSHQFYLGNKKRGYYLLITCGLSHLFLILSKGLQSGFLVSFLGLKLILVLTFFGYALGMPVWIWDLVTLYWQVKNKKGNLSSF